MHILNARTYRSRQLEFESKWLNRQTMISDHYVPKMEWQAHGYIYL